MCSLFQAKRSSALVDLAEAIIMSDLSMERTISSISRKRLSPQSDDVVLAGGNGDGVEANVQPEVGYPNENAKLE